VFHAENVQNPILIQHGLKDSRVVPLMSQLMIDKLKIEGKYFEAVLFEDESHGFILPENQIKSYETIYRFLNKYLKGQE
jgi:dipeptidyl aminopeptidase/acylaminoacyl peptidase